MSNEQFEALTDEDQMAAAPESGQPPGGRENPWNDEIPSPTHLWPDAHHAGPEDEL